MGMFDYIRCEIPLPDGWEATDWQLQSKDFNCEMVRHIITKEGRLMLEHIDAVHEVPKAERAYPNDDGLLGMCGSVRRDTSMHDSNFHGLVNFYGHDGQNNWHEYNAKFTDGQLISIELVPET